MRNCMSLLGFIFFIFPGLSFALGDSADMQPVLAFISQPDVAYVLILIAIYGIFFEFANPGMILPGLIGVAALILALYAFHYIPINYAGLSLMLVGIIFMVVEVYLSSFGIVGFGGVIAFIIGSAMLFDVTAGNYHVTWALIASMSATTAILVFIIANLAIRSHKKAITTGKEGLIGAEGVVLSIMNEQIVVRVLGEIWEAKCDVALHPEEKIKVIKVKGLILFVEPIH